MDLLFDTHAFMWWDSDLDKLPARTQELCLHPDNHLILSVVSVWEMQIKMQLGKLKLVRSLAEIVADQRTRNNVKLLPIYYKHVLELNNLPFHHKDPFDRLLIAQARAEELTILSRDSEFGDYDVLVEWD